MICPWRTVLLTSILVSWAVARVILPPRVCISRCGSGCRLGDLDSGERSRSAQPLLGAASQSRVCQPPVISAASSSSAGAAAQRSPEVGALRRVQAEIPHAVGGEATPVAVGAERRRGRGDDAEHGAVGEAIALGGRRAAGLDERLDAARSGGAAAPGSASRDTTLSIDQRVAPPTSMYSMKRTSAGTLRRTRSGRPSSSSLTPRMTTVSSFVSVNPARGHGRDALQHLRARPHGA